jgi:DNA-binding NarL/FixJ family response regulator
MSAASSAHSAARVLVVDDQSLFRQGLASLLNGQPDFTVVGEAASVEEAVAMARDLRPDLVLMDFSLPDGTGLDATLAILAHRPDTMVVFLTVHEGDEALFAGIRAGARGYLLKNVRVERLLAYLRGLERGEPALEPEMTRHILDAFAKSTPQATDGALSALTAREQEVFAELVTGASNGEIAARLVISPNTVRNHVATILSKLELRNRREVMAYARSRDLRQRARGGASPARPVD